MAKASKKEEGQESVSKFDKKILELEGKFGKGAIINGKDIVENLEVVSTGSINFDVVTGIMGLPLGKLIEYQGMESSGKSTASLHNIAEFQKKYPNDRFVYCDYEHSFDKAYAVSVGVIVEKLTILQPNCSEDGYNLIQALIETGEVRLVIIDSHTAGRPKKVIEGDTGDAVIAMDARINSQALGKIKPILDKYRCTCIGISQIRQDVGSMGETNKSTGGMAWRFYADMRIKFAKVQTDKANESNKTEITIIKSKVAAPWGKATVYINWGHGYDRVQEVTDAAVEFGYIKKGGSWYTLENDSKIQGDEALAEFFETNPEYYEELTTKVLNRIKGIEEPVEVVETV